MDENTPLISERKASIEAKVRVNLYGFRVTTSLKNRENENVCTPWWGCLEVCLDFFGLLKQQRLEVFEQPLEVFEQPLEVFEQPLEVFEQPLEVFVHNTGTVSPHSHCALPCLRGI
jgi:hypothetical protein